MAFSCKLGQYFNMLRASRCQSLFTGGHGHGRMSKCCKFILSSPSSCALLSINMRGVTKHNFFGRTLCSSSGFYSHHISVRTLSNKSARENPPPFEDKEAKITDEEYEEFRKKLSSMKEDITTIPNLLGVCRLISAPVVASLITSNYFTAALILTGTAALTDLADGYIARKWPSQKSVFGSILDPLADKTLMIFLVCSLVSQGLIPFWLASLIIGRDMLLITAASIVRFVSLPEPKTFSAYINPSLATVNFHPTMTSKVNTVVQFGALGVALASPVFGYVGHTYLDYLWYLTGSTTVISGFTYIFSKNTVNFLNKL